ncbi:MAG: copper resistance protein NlpE [Clostridia bacterium]|nr:copper resistance protein NlpE [Clostridia bacterium]
MKKVLAALVSSLAVVALCVCLAACSTSITGTWKFYKASGTVSGMEINYEVGKEIAGGVKISEDFIVLTINEDNTYEMKSAMMGEETQKGTWEQKDGKYYLNVEGESIEMTVKGSTLTFEQEGMKLELKK